MMEDGGEHLHLSWILAIIYKHRNILYCIYVKDSHFYNFRFSVIFWLFAISYLEEVATFHCSRLFLLFFLSVPLSVLSGVSSFNFYHLNFLRHHMYQFLPCKMWKSCCRSQIQLSPKIHVLILAPIFLFLLLIETFFFSWTIFWSLFSFSNSSQNLPTSTLTQLHASSFSLSLANKQTGKQIK